MRTRLRLGLLVVVAGLSVARAAPVEIHPAGSTIPENLLRIELRFAQPQRLPFDVQRVKLIDARGDEVEGALLDLALPSADARRVTVLMDPGRVKSGVGPNLDAGRALRAGDVVSLRIDDDAVGRSPVVKTWRVTAALSHSIEAVAWRLTEPRAGSRDPLIVDLREPISSSGEGLIAVLDPRGRLVRGTTALGAADAVWRFTPSRPWSSGRHSVVIHPELEDPAGNRTCAAFEQLRGSKVRCDTGAAVEFVPISAR